MKWRGCFVFLILFLCNLNAQIINKIPPGLKSELEKKITLRAESISLAAVLNIINTNLKEPVNFSNTVLEKTALHSFDLKNTTIYNCLSAILNKYNAGIEYLNGRIYINYPAKGFRKINGKIIDSETQERITGVNVYIEDENTGTSTDSSGIFTISHINPGIVNIKISCIGYKTSYLYNLDCTLEDLSNLIISLTPADYALNEVVVVPGRFSIIEGKQLSNYSLDNSDINNMSTAGEPLRALLKLPGVSANEYGAKFIVRGGDYDEVQINFDGIELKDPFHIKEFNGGLFSEVDLDIIDNVDFYNGVFPARYGNKLSGIVNINSLIPAKNQTTISAGVNLLNTKFIIKSNPFEKFSYTFALRRGFMDVIFDIINEEDFPLLVYYDSFGKVTYEFDDNNKVHLEYLWAKDNVTGENNEMYNNFTFNSDYNNFHIWLTSENSLKNAEVKTYFLFGKSNYKRDIWQLFYINDEQLHRKIDEQRSNNYWVFKQEIYFPNLFNAGIVAGYEISNSNAVLNFEKDGYAIREINIFKIKPEYLLAKTNLEPVNNRLSAFVSIKKGITPWLFIDSGIRYDYYSLFKEAYLSPRLACSFILSNSITLRTGLGMQNQNQEIYELNIKEDLNELEKPKKMFVGVLSYEHKLTENFSIRVEAYRKQYFNGWNKVDMGVNNTDIATEFNYLRYHYLIEKELIHGLEFLLNFKTSKLDIGLNYSLMKSETDYKFIKDLRSGETFSQRKGVSFRDIPHNLSLNFSFSPVRNFNINFNWYYKSGEPYTEYNGKVIWKKDEPYFESFFEQINSKRLAAYHRMDLKFNYLIESRLGDFNLQLEIMNIYNHRNIRGYENSFNINELIPNQNSKVIIDRTPLYWLPLVPVFGVNWKYNL